ncbi:hypothetical protein [Inmirania thermothiophila]|uniref:PilZ domain-containing protein n=1 Tax=Inmirania thermothiophila TaxID=1750597 RepID=A0A3N1YCF4_9GAMM|nr:hypothetical protein [Inmirania thermothiophila]ROR35077.1 hypothetical protein EDC57_0994 [Inmirania thermothiophila]
MAQLPLTVPPVSEVRDPRVPVRPGEVRAFIAELPLADPRGAAARLAEAVARLNRQPLAVAERLALLEIYREGMETVQQLLRAPLRADPNAVRRSRVREGLAPLRRLVREMGYGYKQAVLADVGDHGGGPRHLALAITRALEMLSLELAHAWEAYLPAPTHAWRELHALLAHGCARGILERQPRRDIPAPRIAYVRTALLALADPYRLPAGGLWQVARYLEEAAPAAPLLPPQPARPAPEGYFVVDLAANARPLPLTEVTAPLEPARHRLLDSAGPVAALRRSAEALEAGDAAPAAAFGEATPPMHALHLVRHLLRAWWAAPRRRHGRRERLVQVAAVCGLRAAQARLRRREAEPSLGGEIEIRSLSGLHSAEALAGAGEEAHQWRLLNHGPNGVALGVPAEQSGALRVGDLVAFRNPAAEGEAWLTGIVRWLSHAHGDEVRIGVEYLPGGAFGCEVSVEGEDGPTRTQQPALAVERGDGMVEVVAPHGLYRPGATIRLEAGDGATHLEPRGLVETTRTLDRFLAVRL